jgi:tripartite-type tricarboxylate transporter receptor subunit TctC
VGSTQHLSAKLFETVAGIDALVVPYKGSPAVLTALRSGEIDLAFEVLGPMVPQVAGGWCGRWRCRRTSATRLLPEVPTVQQAGVAGYNVASWNAIAAPAGTPPEVVATLNQAVREAVASPAVQEQAGPLGMRLQAPGIAGRAAGPAGQRDPALGRGDPGRCRPWACRRAATAAWPTRCRGRG